MNKELIQKIKESASSILPVSILIMIINLLFVQMPISTLLLFIFGTFFLIVGMGIFTLGSDLALMPIGENLGEKLTLSRKFWLLILSAFILGVVITVAEPDLQVLANQVPSIPSRILIIAVSISVGFFLVIAILRILLQIKMSTLIIILYGLVFFIGFISKSDYIAIGFDSGGVTTGPIAVPFILALGSGVSKARGSDKTSENDSFGLCGICSVGPMLALIVLGLFYPSTSNIEAEHAITEVTNIKTFLLTFKDGLLTFGKEVFVALLPILILFFIFQFFLLKIRKKEIIKILIGMGYSFVGLTLFLTGVNIGFMPTGKLIGMEIASLPNNYVIYPISILLGFVVISAEPAVYALNKQIEEITGGAISKTMMMIGLSAGVGISLLLAVIRVMTGINIWFFLVPGYFIALSLSFFVPELFTAIALDSGGVASGAMAATFLLPYARGASEALGGNPIKDAFGIVAMIAMMPIISVQIVGLIYKIKLKKAESVDNTFDDIVDFNDNDEITDL